MTRLDPLQNDDTPTNVKVLSAAAQRALEEAAQRRLSCENGPLSGEHDGPKGVEPTRFGDWERKGIAYDF